MEIDRGTRLAGWALIVGPLLSVFAMSHHPSAGASGTAERMAELVRLGPLSAVVHGSLIALMVLIFWGLTRLAGVLGWSSSGVQLAAIAYGLGVVCMTGAAAVSGFIVPGLAGQYEAATPAATKAAVAVFRFSFEVNQALAKIGAVAQSAGIFLWSWALARRAEAPTWVRAVGWIGLAVGALPVIGLVAGRLTLNVAGMTAVVLAQAAWTMGVGAWLVTRARRGAS